jgi:hypothetical protein
VTDRLELATPSASAAPGSPSTERLYRGEKIALYARAGTVHARLVNPLQRTLEVPRPSAEQARRWLSLGAGPPGRPALPASR